MAAVTVQPLPAPSFLRRYLQAGAYVDCYATELPGHVSQARFVEAFYTTWIFKLERAILAWVVDRPSSDAEATGLAHGEVDSFAAWDVERQSDNQLLLRDLHGRTRSWLMAVPVDGPAGATTRLYFGSAVVRVASQGAGKRGGGFRLLLGFHKVYSKVLLATARSRLLAEAA